MTRSALKSDKIIPVLKEAAGHGVDVDGALDQLTELVEAAGRNTRADLASIKTEIGTKADGSPLVVGWDTCYACKSHIQHCGCKNGPMQPPYITAWVDQARADIEAREARLTGSLPAAVGIPEISKVPFSPEAGSVSGESPIPKSAVDLMVCTNCRAVTNAAMGDRNDDGTFTCFSCQESA